MERLLAVGGEGSGGSRNFSSDPSASAYFNNIQKTMNLERGFVGFKNDVPSTANEFVGFFYIRILEQLSNNE
jgi:hypothetical protein